MLSESDLTVPQLLDIVLQKLPIQSARFSIWTKPEIEGIEAKAHLVLSRIHSFRNALNPMHRLPPETLCTIFQYAAEYDGRYPPTQSHFMTLRAVTHVCSYWRMTAVAFASLWCTIQVQNMDIARKFLERSKSALLDVYIPLTRTIREDFWGALLPHIPRFRRFYLEQDSISDTSASILSDEPALFLQHLDIDSLEPVQHDFPGLFSSTQNLSSIHLQGIKPWKCRQFVNLKHISIARLRDPLTAEDLIEFLQGNPLLETLELKRVEICSQKNERHIRLPHLRRLHVSGGTPIAILNTLVLETACSMTIRGVGESEDGVSSIFTLALPEDTSSLFNVQGVNRLAIHVGRRDVRVVAANPSTTIELATVGIFPQAFAEASIGYTNSFPMENITELWIHGFRAISNSPDWDGFFGNMNVLETLYLDGCACDPILDAIRQNEGLLPRLRRVNFYVPYYLTYQCAMLLRVARWESGRPLYLEYLPEEDEQVVGRRSAGSLGLELNEVFDSISPGGICPVMTTNFD